MTLATRNYDTTTPAKLIAISAVLTLLPIAGIAAGDSKAAVIDRVSMAMAAFSSGKRTTFVASYTDAPSILDDVAPYGWHNAGAWFDRVRPLFRNLTMRAGTPLEVLVDRDSAFIAVPMTIDGETAKGKALKGRGYWTGTLVLTSGVWRVANAAITITE
jgi:hypothetical protein